MKNEKEKITQVFERAKNQIVTYINIFKYKYK